MTNDNKTSVTIDKSSRDELATSASLLGKTMKQTITELAAALVSNRYGLERLLAISGSISIGELLTYGIEQKVKEADLRRDSLYSASTFKPPVVETPKQKIAAVINDCKTWEQLSELAKLPDNLVPPTSIPIFNKQYYYHNQYLLRETDYKYGLDIHKGEIIKND